MLSRLRRFRNCDGSGAFFALLINPFLQPFTADQDAPANGESWESRLLDKLIGYIPSDGELVGHIFYRHGHARLFFRLMIRYVDRYRVVVETATI